MYWDYIDGALVVDLWDDRLQLVGAEAFYALKDRAAGCRVAGGAAPCGDALLRHQPEPGVHSNDASVTGGSTSTAELAVEVLA